MNRNDGNSYLFEPTGKSVLIDRLSKGIKTTNIIEANIIHMAGT
jgi:hypothetical protein